jgi:hypothetical protein
MPQIQRKTAGKSSGLSSYLRKGQALPRQLQAFLALLSL